MLPIFVACDDDDGDDDDAGHGDVSVSEDDSDDDDVDDGVYLMPTIHQQLQFIVCILFLSFSLLFAITLNTYEQTY